MTTAYIKRNDTARVISDALTLDGAAINLTGATVSLCLRNITTGASFKHAATVTNAVGGRVEYAMQAADTATAGRFRLEWEIVLSSGAVLTVPDDDYHTLNILEDLA